MIDDKLQGSILAGKRHIHFIGIGGSGMYPLAQILHAKSFTLSGSDNNETATLQAVRDLGITVYPLGQRAENIRGADLIVHTAAIMADNPELIAARASGVPVLERSELLGIVSSWFDNAVCVSGTHGKTTTTSMLTQILLDAGQDISAIIGGKLPSIGGSGLAGGSETFVCEACEFVDSFLRLSPDVAIILNIDDDHLDYFKTVENIIRSFTRFCTSTSRAIIANGDDANTMTAVRAADTAGKQIITFGFAPGNDYYPADIINHPGAHTDFTLMHNGEPVIQLSIFVPGRHNVLNAVAACAAALLCGASADDLRTGLEHFHGAGRRFERLAEVGGVTVVDDYAHHPTELAVTLRAAKEMRYKRVWAVFQPFTYSRTAMLLDDFVEALSIADRVVLTEIMGSREKNTYNIYSKDLGERIDGCVWFDTFDEVADYVASNAEPGDLVITLGCGDVYKVAHKIIAARARAGHDA